jgi:FdhD protein
MPQTNRIMQRIRRVRAGNASPATDFLAVEEPLEIRIGNRMLTVTMRTPGDDAELAAGFLYGEGLVRSAAEIVNIGPHPRDRGGNVLNITIGDTAEFDWTRLRRHFAGNSSCGLCGRESIAALRRRLPRVRSNLRVSADVLVSLPHTLRKAQSVFDTTGGLHAAAVFDGQGRLLVAREDIGRHNALDKVVGWGLLSGKLPFANQIMLVSGRASFEIVQKVLAARVPILCAVSAPSSLAVELAEAGGLTLVGFLRDASMNIYCGSRRITKGVSSHY